MSEINELGLGPEQQKQIAQETLERYSGSDIHLFQPMILITNFPHYVDYFATSRKSQIYEGSMFKVSHCKKAGISMIDFKIGSPAAALVVDLCAFLPIRAMLFLGMCGGLRSDYKVGEYFVPVASIRGDATSDFYFPPEVPALANFNIQKVVTNVLEQEKATFHVGITHTTNKRFWEFNAEFRNRLKTTRPQAVEMECATLFTASYSHRLALGALLLISDLPFAPGGLKTKKSSEFVFKNFMPDQIEKGVKILHELDKTAAFKKANKSATQS
jgi:AMP nucleosidase